MSKAAGLSAARFRIERGTPKGGESAVATLARGLLRPDNHQVSHRVDQYGQLVETSGKKGRTIYSNFLGLDSTDQISLILSTGAAASLATDTPNLMYSPDGNVFNVVPLGAGQTLPPVVVSNGLNIGGDQVDTEGYEVFSHFAGATGSPFCVGNDPAFFFECKLLVADVSGLNPLLVGFRRAMVNKATYTDYTDYAAVGFDAADGTLSILTGNDGVDVATDTTQSATDATALTIRVNVSAAGVVTYRINGAAPTVTAAFTFDDGDPLIPFVHSINSADLAGEVAIQTWRTGYQ